MREPWHSTDRADWLVFADHASEQPGKDWQRRWCKALACAEELRRHVSDQH